MKIKKCLKIFCVMLTLILTLSTTQTVVWAIEDISSLEQNHADCIYGCEHTPSLVESLGIAWQEVPVAASEEEMQNILAEYINSLDGDVIIITDPIDSCQNNEEMQQIMAGLLEGPSNIQLPGNHTHTYFSSSCQGNHVGRVDCTVYCSRSVKCGTCDSPATIIVNETSHSWSVGWCGQTCTRCGSIEMFHSPGGCSHCR